MKNPQSNDYSAEEAARRRDEVIKRMLNTPPQPRRAKPPQPRRAKPPNEAKKRPAQKARPKLPS